MGRYKIEITSPDFGLVDVTANSRAVDYSRSIHDSAGSLTLEIMSAERDFTMCDIALFIDNVLKFLGTVKSQKAQPEAGVVVWQTLECVDGSDKLHRRLVNAVYRGKTPKQIITDVITRLMPAVDLTNVQDVGNLIEEIRFDYDSVGTTIQKLSEMTGASWYMDENNGLHFFANYEQAAPTGFEESDIMDGSLNVETVASDLANRLWIIGAKAASPKYVEQYWYGDSQNDLFNLSFVPNYPEVYENGVLKTIEVDKDTLNSDKDYTYNKKEKVLKRTAGVNPIGTTVRFKYRPTVQLVDYFEDAASIAKYGLYEKVIRDKKLTDKLAARARGRAALKKTKGIVKHASFRSYKKWDYEVGMVAYVNCPFAGYTQNSVITSVRVSCSPEIIMTDYEVEGVVYVG